MPRRIVKGHINFINPYEIPFSYGASIAGPIGAPTPTVQIQQQLMLNQSLNARIGLQNKLNEIYLNE